MLWLICASWLSLTLLTFLFVDATSIRNWVLVTAIALAPLVVLLKLWGEGHPKAVAEVLFAMETRR